MSAFTRDVALGFRTYFKSFGFIVRHNMLHFYLYPVAFILLFSVGSFFGIRALVDTIEPFLNDLLGLDRPDADGVLESMLLAIKKAGRYVTHAVIWVSMMFLYYKINKYIVLIVMSPVMTVISERVDRIVTGRKYPMSLGLILKDAMRGVLIAVRNGILELIIVIALLILNLVVTLIFPPIAFIFTPAISVLIFVIGAYFYGFSTIDYSSERYRLSFRRSIRLVRRNKGIAIANGTIFTLWLMIPIFGTYVGTIFAPITCTVGATLALLEKGVYRDEPELTTPTSSTDVEQRS